jgi:hypothetical protein
MLICDRSLRNLLNGYGRHSPSPELSSPESLGLRRFRVFFFCTLLDPTPLPPALPPLPPDALPNVLVLAFAPPRPPFLAALAPVFFLRALAAAPRAAPPRFLAALAAFARLLGRSEEDSVFAFQHERLGI